MTELTETQREIIRRAQTQAPRVFDDPGLAKARAALEAKETDPCSR